MYKKELKMLSSSEDEILADQDLQAPALFIEKTKTRFNNLPPSTKYKYTKTYHKFINWKNEKNLESFTENVFLTYFNELSKKLQPSSLWPVYSVLKTTLRMNHNVNIQKFGSVTKLIKNLMSGYVSKKSGVFTSRDVETFLKEAPDEIYLATKVALIFGISGACTSLELVNITVDDVKRLDKLLVVKLSNPCTNVKRTFVVRSEFLEIVKKYEALRPNNVKTNRYFLNYLRGKCTNQVIGRNKVLSMSKEIAAYLKLPNPALYTGYCFRKTSVNLIADSGASLKGSAGWSVEENKDAIENYNSINMEIRNKLCPPPTLRDNDFANINMQLTTEDKTKEISMQQCPLDNEEVNVSQYADDDGNFSDSSSLKQTDSQITEISTGFKCRSCEDEIFGFRYVCVECAEYNLCINCEGLSDHPTHYMLRIPGGKSQAEANQVLERIRKELVFYQTNTDIQEQRDSIVTGHRDNHKQEENADTLLVEVIKHEIVEDPLNILPADISPEMEKDSTLGYILPHAQETYESDFRTVSKRIHKNKTPRNIDCVKPRPISALTTENEDISPREKKLKIEIQLEDDNEVYKDDYFHSNISQFAKQSSPAENFNFTPSSGRSSEIHKIIELKLDKCFDTKR